MDLGYYSFLIKYIKTRVPQNLCDSIKRASINIYLLSAYIESFEVLTKSFKIKLLYHKILRMFKEKAELFSIRTL